MDKTGYIIVLVTAPDEAGAASMAEKIVTEGLAACCNIVPGIRSIYTWKGELCRESETLCIFKTRAALFERLRKRVIELHSYEVPEVVALDIAQGSDDYLRWLGEVTAD